MTRSEVASVGANAQISHGIIKAPPAPAAKLASRLSFATVKSSPVCAAPAPPPASPLPRPPPALRDGSVSPAPRAASDAAATQELRAAAAALHGVASALASRMGGARGDDGDGCLSPAPTRATGLPSPRGGSRRAASRPVDASSDSDAVASRRSRLAAARVAATLGKSATDAVVLSALSPTPPVGTTPRAARDHLLLSQDAEPSLFASIPSPSRAPSAMQAAAASDSERAAAAAAAAATAAAAANERAAAAAHQAQVAADATRGLQPSPFAGMAATPPRVRTSAAPAETPGDAARAARRAAAVQAATTATSSVAAAAVSAASLGALVAAEVADVAARAVGAVGTAAADARDAAVARVVATAHAGKAAVHAGVASAAATATAAAVLTATTALAAATATRGRVVAAGPALAHGSAILAFSLAMHCTLELRHEQVRSAVVCALAGVGVPGAACAPVLAKPVFFW